MSINHPSTNWLHSTDHRNSLRTTLCRFSFCLLDAKKGGIFVRMVEVQLNLSSETTSNVKDKDGVLHKTHQHA